MNRSINLFRFLSNIFSPLFILFFCLIAQPFAAAKAADVQISPGSIDIAGTFISDSPISFTVDAAEQNDSTLYYKFFYCANYGTAAYENSPWVVMQEYSITNSCTYTFPQAGSYIVVVRIVTDPNNEPVDLSIIGGVVTIGSGNDIYITSMSSGAIGAVDPGTQVTYTVTASNSSEDILYFKWFYRANYGTSDYDVSPWVVMQDYSTDNSCNYTFPSVGSYIIVVRAVSDPINEPANLPIIGTTTICANQYAADVEGIWATTLTGTGGNQMAGEQLWAFSLVDHELEYIREDDGFFVGYPVSMDGADISFSFEDDLLTVKITGEVENDSMSGTWSDSDGDSGTWQAGKNITVEGVQTIIYEDGETLMVLDQEGGGAATFYGTVSSENGEPTFTSIICETEDGDLVITLNASEQITELSIGDIQLTVTYNSDGTFNFDMFSDGQKVYDGSNLGSASIQTLNQVSALKELQPYFLKDEYAHFAEASEASAPSYQFQLLAGTMIQLIYDGFFEKFKMKLIRSGGTYSYDFREYIDKKKEYQEICKSLGTISALYLYRLAAIAKECNDPSVILKEVCMRNYQKANKVFVDYRLLLASMVEGMLEQAYEDFLIESVPNIVGTFKGTYSVYVRGCDDGTSGSFGGSMVIVIKSQSDNAFSGTFTGVLSIGIVENGTINGTIDNQGQVNGTTTHTAAGTAGNGTFSGTYSDDILTITNSGRDTAGDTCLYTRQITTSR